MQSLADTAEAAGRSEEETAELLAACREKLFRAREGRPRPHLDNKVCCAVPGRPRLFCTNCAPPATLPAGWVHASCCRCPPASPPLPAARTELLPPRKPQVVTAWNGMAISAYAQAARALAHEQPPARRLFPVEARPRREYLLAAQKVSQYSFRACAQSAHMAAVGAYLGISNSKLFAGLVALQLEGAALSVAAAVQHGMCRRTSLSGRLAERACCRSHMATAPMPPALCCVRSTVCRLLPSCPSTCMTQAAAGCVEPSHGGLPTCR